MTESVKPRAAVDQFQRERAHEVAESTVVNQKYHLKSLVEWTRDIELDDLSDLNGFVLNQYKTWRRDNSEINDQTLYNNLMTIKAFLNWCEKRELVEDGLPEKLDIPKPEDPTRNTTITPERAEDLIGYYQQFEYASREHVLFHLLYHTGIRIGTASAFDVDDWDAERYRLYARHRPETGTPLKNGKEGERAIVIKDDTLRAALADYIDRMRLDVEDEHGRKPLFPSRRGRATTQTLRLYVETLSQPCRYTGECPHQRDQSECSATVRIAEAYECPSAVSPHTIRRSAITAHLNADIPKDVVSGRMNVSQKVLEAHYDQRTEDDKADLREGYLENL